MKSLVAIIAALGIATAFAAEPAKAPEAVKAPAATASAPATPKEMPKVEKPAKKHDKKADATKSEPAKDQKAEAPKK